MIREKIAVNNFECFVCSQSKMTPDGIDVLLNQGISLSCKWCGATHKSFNNEYGYSQIFVIGVKDAPH